MTINKRDVGFAVLGASLTELVHNLTGKTPLEKITNILSNKKKDELINCLIDEAEELSSEEKKAIVEAMNFEPVFKIVTGIDKPESLIDKNLEAKAELILEEIEKKDKETYSSIIIMKSALAFGMRRLNRLNKFLIENKIDDIIQIHNILLERYSNRHEHYDKWLKAFNFDPKEEDQIENIAYGVEKLLNRKSTQISATQMTIMLELEKRYSKVILNKYIDFLSYIRESSVSEHRKFLRMMHDKYSTSPEETLKSIKEAMEITSNSVRKKYFDIT